MSNKDEALKLALEALGWYDRETHQKAITAIREALVEQSARRQNSIEPIEFLSGFLTERLAIERGIEWTPAIHDLCNRAIEEEKLAEQPAQQEPVAWLITDENINSIQIESIQRLIDRARHAHMTDIKLRINGQDEWHQADWLKHLTRTTPPHPKEPEQEPVAWATQMGEYAHIHWCAKRPEYPVVYEVPLYTSPPASKPLVGLTDGEVVDLCDGRLTTWEQVRIARAIEAKLREKNA